MKNPFPIPPLFAGVGGSPSRWPRRARSPGPRRRPPPTRSPRCSRIGVRFERPPLQDGAPDYTQRPSSESHAALHAWRRAASRRSTRGSADRGAGGLALVRAELNGFDFYCRVPSALGARPGVLPDGLARAERRARARGTVHHDVVELWTYAFPLSRAASEACERAPRSSRRSSPRPAATLRATPTISGSPAPARCAARSRPSTTSRRRRRAAAARSSRRSAARARRPSPSSPGSTRRRPRRPAPSGIGRENYDWMLQNVHLIPMTWQDEVTS